LVRHEQREVRGHDQAAQQGNERDDRDLAAAARSMPDDTISRCSSMTITVRRHRGGNLTRPPEPALARITGRHSCLSTASQQEGVGTPLATRPRRRRPQKVSSVAMPWSAAALTRSEPGGSWSVARLAATASPGAFGPFAVSRGARSDRTVDRPVFMQCPWARKCACPGPDALADRRTPECHVCGSAEPPCERFHTPFSRERESGRTHSLRRPVMPR
jgi:hypothetical protein